MGRHGSGKPAQPAPAGTSGPATVFDVARAAGVSHTTVSRVFNKSPLISEPTRLRVLAAAAKANYHPNLMGRSLKTGRSEAAVVVLPESRLVPFYSQALVGLFDAVKDRFQVSVQLSPTDHAPDLVCSIAASRRFDIMAVYFELLGPRDFQALHSMGVPVVLINYVPPNPKKPPSGCVGFDNRQGIREGVDHLVFLGHRRIAYLGGTRGGYDADEREAEFRSSMKRHKIAVLESAVAACEFEKAPTCGEEAMQRMLALHRDPPTAVICASDYIAFGAVNAARRWGLQVPGDLSVIGYDDVDGVSHYNPPLTTVGHRGTDLGWNVGSLLLELYAAPDSRPRSIILPTRLVIRESTAKPRAARK